MVIIMIIMKIITIEKIVETGSFWVCVKPPRSKSTTANKNHVTRDGDGQGPSFVPETSPERKSDRISILLSSETSTMSVFELFERTYVRVCIVETPQTKL